MTYTNKEKTYDDIFSLGKDMYLDSDVFASLLREKELLSFVQEKDPGKAEKISALLSQALPDDVLVFKASFILNPYMTFRIRGLIFDDYQKLGEQMLYSAPHLHPVFAEVIRYGLVSEHMETTLQNQEKKEFYQEIKNIEALAQKDLELSYFSLGYRLSGKKTIIYDGQEYANIYNLCYYLIQRTKHLYTLGTSLGTSSLLRAYAEYSPDGKILDEFFHLCQSVDSETGKFSAFIEKRKGK